MDSIKRVYSNNKRTIREIKNKVYNYSEMEQMVREATCNDASEPQVRRVAFRLRSPVSQAPLRAQVMLMREIAKGTFTVEFSAIMNIIWKRIREIKNEWHPLKCAARAPLCSGWRRHGLATLRAQVPDLARVPPPRGEQRDGPEPDPEQPAPHLVAHCVPADQ